MTDPEPCSTISRLDRLREMGFHWIRTDDDGDTWIGTNDDHDAVPIQMLLSYGRFQGDVVVPDQPGVIAELTHCETDSSR